MGFLEPAAMKENHEFSRSRLPQIDDEDFAQVEGYTIVGHIHDEAILEATSMSRADLKARLMADRMPVDSVAAEMERWEECSSL